MSCVVCTQVQEIALSSLEEVSQPETPADGVREAGARVWVKLRLGMDYDLLVAQPQRLAAFKSDIAHWLREVVGVTKYIYGTGGIGGKDWSKGVGKVASNGQLASRQCETSDNAH
jgi:hypothetical protein